MAEQTINFDRVDEIDERVDEIIALGMKASVLDSERPELADEWRRLLDERRAIINSVFPPVPENVKAVLSAYEDLARTVAASHYFVIDKDDFWYTDCTCGWGSHGTDTASEAIRRAQEHRAEMEAEG